MMKCTYFTPARWWACILTSPFCITADEGLAHRSPFFWERQERGEVNGFPLVTYVLSWLGILNAALAFLGWRCYVGVDLRLHLTRK